MERSGEGRGEEEGEGMERSREGRKGSGGRRNSSTHYTQKAMDQTHNLNIRT